MKQIEVQIMGQGYLLSCPEGGEAMLYKAVERVDSAMCRIRDAGKVKARDRIAVLASLNLAFELSELEARKSAEAAVAPSPLPAPVTDTPIATGDTTALTDVLRRLDAVLDHDGQLI